jgi:hypothetical protein
MLTTLTIFLFLQQHIKDIIILQNKRHDHHECDSTSSVAKLACGLAETHFRNVFVAASPSQKLANKSQVN